MVDYNPHRTQVLGNEWVPIKQADYQPDALTERGYTFTQALATPGSLQGAGFTVGGANDFSSRFTAQVIALYPAGQEAATGPIYETVVTPDAASVITDGASVVTFDGGATSLADALAAKNDGKSFTFTNDVIDPIMRAKFYFSVVIPAGRRIVSVDLDYQIEYPEPPPPTLRALNALKPLTDIMLLREADGGAGTNVVLALGPQETSFDSFLAQTAVIGELNHFWEGVTTVTTEAYPWTSTQLGWFAPGAPAANKLNIILNSGDFSGSPTPILGLLTMGYLALRIRYCAETRVRFGAWCRTAAREYSPVTPGPPGGLGTQFCHLRDLTLAKTVLPAGDYTITQTNVFSPFAADQTPAATPGTPPPMAAIRQLRSAAPPNTNGALLAGVLVNRSTTLGATFSAESSDVIVPLTLGEGTLPTPTVDPNTHAYADQIAAPVYAAITATQLIATAAATGQNYNRVRFYARKIGITPAALTVASVETGAATATITLAAFDALPEIIDGWKQVDLILAANVNIPAASTRNIRWTSSSSTEGNRWEILGARAKTMTGIGTGTGAWDQAPATYGGSASFASWKPESQATIQTDTLGDLTVMLSATPVPAVTGLTATVNEEAIPVIAPLCADTSTCCIATAIKHVDLAWTASTLGASQFAFYLIQRLGTDGVTWETIGTSTNVARNSLRDREGRVGVLESYRVITVDGAGAQGVSATVTATIAAPGVTIGCAKTSGILILTSNTSNTAAFTLGQAWKMVWDGNPEEGFLFPEAAENDKLRLYQRDYRTAFRPTERGGTEFSRDLLIAASLSVPIVEENFTRLRDIAWAQIPYVCVRDEMGNRWYMTVDVPEGTIVRQGHFSVCNGVKFTQVTATPAPVPAP